MNKKISALNLSQRLTSLGLERSYQRLFSVIKKNKKTLFGSFGCNLSIRVALFGSLLLIGGVLGFGEGVEAQTRIIYEDFEDGLAWDYSNNFDRSSVYLADEWDIVANAPHGGVYCAESRIPGDLWIEDSTFHFSILPNGFSDEVFIRFWMKTPIDWLDQATDNNGGANWMRFGTGMSNDWTNGGEFWNPESLHVYDDLPVKSMGMSFNKNNQWHEYALYLKMPTNADSEDGIIRCWEDPAGNYSITNANANYVDIDINVPWSHMISPHYYKGATDGNWTFWLDDIEVWEGIPSQTDLTPPSLSNPQPTGTLTSGTTSTTISLDTDETATCKYSVIANTNYDDMSNVFAMTDSTDHSTDVTDLEDGNSCTYYIKCQDESNNQNTDDFEISFSIASSATYSISNFINLVSSWLSSGSGLESDVNGDGVVNTRDLGIMMSNWQ